MMGDTTRSVTVPAQSGRALTARAGDLLEIVDLEGHQVGDLWVIDEADHWRWLSTSHTRDRLERMFPQVGEQFTDQTGQPILELVADASPGRHDMLFPPCNRWLYESEGFQDHPNCQDNFVAAAKSVGVSLPVVPDPVNIFQNSMPQADGTLTVLTAASEAGDSVTLKVLRPAVVILTSCSVDYWPTNNLHCTPLLARLSSP